eukprot:gnl/Dysnectes_brevis/1737_a1981_2096.p1 GENE.gnl/Dysnectes_brevis/1737_a1981_2096~~gnl/Dysnectes_brevis/1737_a1981_2096.p1  ORF type:complete len:650 (-),score=112.95 gnl/Dysnectes_brevis/1737_a1981_2096:55-2004(-)
MLRILLALSVLTYAFSTQTPVGVRSFLTNTGLQRIATSIETSVKTRAIGYTVDSLHFSGSDLTYVQLSDLVVDQFSFTQTTTIHPAYFIDINIDHLSFSAHSQWSYSEANVLKGQGDGTYSSQNGNAAIQLQLREDPANPGSLLCGISSISLDVSAIDFDLTGEGLPDQQIITLVLQILEPLFQTLVGNRIEDLMQDTINESCRKLEQMIPQSKIYDDYTSLFFELVPETAGHTLDGSYYSDNHFDSWDHTVSYSAFDLVDFDIKNYRSINVTGFFTPLEYSDDWQFRAEYDQILRLSVGDKSEGDLELWNIGACWPEHFSLEVHGVSAGPSTPQPIMIEYQSGCGGGWFQLYSRKGGSGSWEQIPDLDLYNNNNEPSPQLPVILSTDPYPFIAIATAMRFEPINGMIPESEHHDLSTTPIGSTADHWQLLFDSAVLDSFAKSHIEGDWLETQSITESMIPSGFKSVIDLTTEFWDTYIPGLAARWPGYNLSLVPGVVESSDVDAQVEVDVTADTQITIVASIPFGIVVVDSNNTVLEHVADMSSALELHISDAAITQGYDPRLVFQLDELALTALRLTWTASWVQQIAPTDVLLDALQQLLELTVMPRIDQTLLQGVPVPVPEGVGLTACRTVFGDGEIFFGTTLELQ